MEEVGALRLLLPADAAGPEEVRPVGSHVRAAGSQGPGVGRLGRLRVPGRCLPFTSRSPHRDAEQDLDSSDPDGTGRPRSSPPLPPAADGLGSEQDPLARMHTGENVGQVPARGGVLLSLVPSSGPLGSTPESGPCGVVHEWPRGLAGLLRGGVLHVTCGPGCRVGGHGGVRGSLASGFRAREQDRAGSAPESVPMSTEVSPRTAAESAARWGLDCAGIWSVQWFA